MAQKIAQKQQKNSKRVPGTPFKPGQSGNPNGRPKGESMTAILRKKLAAAKGDATVRDKIADEVIEMALNRDKWAIDYITDRTEGKAIERIENKEVYEFDYELSKLSKLTPNELIAEYNRALQINDN